MRLGADIDQRGQGFDGLAFVHVGQKPDRPFVADNARRFSLPDNVFGTCSTPSAWFASGKPSAVV